ncbi:hypothetical protein [uncultured Alistipes sp.]|uniref:hypothetical protein n=1 Tax=uncultured Alistipes sp. TaxID=538949 RepID=UPI00261E5356|nr:hypothetical protein [uncultured Alistipes sp.]
MSWRERLPAVLTSRWTERAYMVVIVGCLASRTDAGRRAALVLCALLCAGILLATLPALLRLRRATRDWPDTPEGREHARRTAQRLEKENKNKIEL